MKIRVTLSIGIQGKQEDVLEYPDDCLEGMDKEQIEAFLNEEWKHWSANYIDGGASIIDD